MGLRLGLRIALLGRGAWGETLAALWSGQGHSIRSWSRRDGPLPPDLLAEAELVVAAVSMAGIEPIGLQLAGHWPDAIPLLSCSKGIDLDRLATPTQLWRRHLPPQVPLLVLSGPNLATELRRGLPAASVLSSDRADLAADLQLRLSGPSLRLYTNDDPVGTEVAGALKNVMAVAAGISDGLSLGANARASLLCRGLAEIGVVLEGLGGRCSTLYGLAGLGDLLATATSELSRNYRFGLFLAEGLEPAEAERRIGATVEGPRTARAAVGLAQRHGWSLPICAQVVRVLQGSALPREAVQALMERDLRSERQP
ncbi:MULTISPECIES: NAD(P)H-dependent glycerol-3-phosphate dehydrogenase [Aphanothece]|uniref:NAD(P)H-dependent glycerol-3-phosphate dehydrogenase n=1 Tax=Aphanothece TaxID=1121 RepID=UPI0039850A06